MNRTNNYVEKASNSGEPYCVGPRCTNCIFSYELVRYSTVVAICRHYGHVGWISTCYWQNKAFLDGLVAFIEGEWYEVEQ